MAKRKRSKAGRRLYAMGRGAGVKSTAINAGAGAATGLAAGIAAENISMLRSRWWITPLVAAIGGHFLKSVNRDVGAGVVGAAGGMGFMSYQLSKLAASQGVQGVQDEDTGDVDYVDYVNSLPEARGMQDGSPVRVASSVMGLQG